jgi:hypothetical protein
MLFCFKLVAVYHERSRKWLDESNKPEREEALSEAMRNIDVVPHRSSQVLCCFFLACCSSFV